MTRRIAAVSVALLTATAVVVLASAANTMWTAPPASTPQPSPQAPPTSRSAAAHPRLAVVCFALLRRAAVDPSRSVRDLDADPLTTDAELWHWMRLLAADEPDQPRSRP